MSVMDKARERCRCRCGYTCGRSCDLGIMECMRVHYVKDCDHEWDGPPERDEHMETATCSRCGMRQIAHDFAKGP